MVNTYYLHKLIQRKLKTVILCKIKEFLFKNWCFSFINKQQKILSGSLWNSTMWKAKLKSNSKKVTASIHMYLSLI